MRTFGIVLSIITVFPVAGQALADSTGRFPGKGSQDAWNHASRMSIKGGNLASQGKHSEAIELFKQAQSLYPYDATFPYNLGNSAAKVGQFSTAEDSYKKAIGLEPRYYSAWYNLGYLYSKAGKFDQAKAAYDKALALRPSSADALYEYAVVLEKEGKYAEATAFYGRAKAVAPTESDKQQIEDSIRKLSSKMKTAGDRR